ncbi:outer membrane protein assembly factor BamE [bacterium]|nr:MAG: outer membrane protein assembly factor BamE [bacterium]
MSPRIPLIFNSRSWNWAVFAVLSCSLFSGCALLPRPRGLARFPKGTPATKAKLEQVKPGMTVAQVEAIFGSPGHTSKGSSHDNPPFLSWTNEDLTAAIIMFENGRVTQRMNAGGLK